LQKKPTVAGFTITACEALPFDDEPISRHAEENILQVKNGIGKHIELNSPASKTGTLAS
jgi:hypothetical protein